MKASHNSPVSFCYHVILLLTLLWLSVGISFMYLDQQQKIDGNICAKQDLPAEPDENACPFDDTEESPENCNNTFASEYLQEDFEGFLNSGILLKHHKSRYNGAFILFHVESFSPPPDPLS